MSHGQLDAVVRHIRQLAGGGEGACTDGQLLHQFVACRDGEAFAALVRRHGGLIRSVCRHILHHEQDVEDALQATLLVLARKAASIRDGDSVASWLYGVAYRTAMNARKTAARRRERERQAGSRSPEQPVSEAALRELQALLDEEVQRLPQKYRAPFVLCCLEGKSKAEAARDLGWKEGTVSGRLAQARKRLQQRLTRRGVTLSAALCATGVFQDTATAAVSMAAIRGVLAYTAGKAETVSAAVVALAEGVLQTMFVAKLKLGVVLLLAMGTLATSAGLAAYHAAAANRLEAKQTGTPNLVAERKEQPKHDVDQPVLRDRYGDPLPPHALARMGTLHWRLGGAGAAQWADFSPDGKRLVTVNVRHEWSVWDVATGRRIHHMPADPALVRGGPDNLSTWCMTFSADHQTLACGEQDGTVRVVDPWTGKERCRLVGHGGLVNSVALSPDGRVLLSRSVDQTLRIWDTVRGEQLRQFSMPTEKLQYMSVALSPDAKSMAWIGHPEIAIHVAEVETGKERYQLGGHDQTIQRVVFSPDGRTLASTGNGSPVRLWDAATGRPVCTVEDKERSGWVYVRFAPDGKTLLASRYTEPVQLWDVASGRELWHIPAYPQVDGGMVFTPDGKGLILQRTCMSAIWRYDAATGKQLPFSEEAHSNEVNALAFSPDGQTLVSVGGDGTLRWWEAITGKQLREMLFEVGSTMALSDDRRLLAVTRAGMIQAYDTSNGKHVLEIPTRGYSDYAVAFSPDGRVLGWAGSAANTGKDYCVALFDAATGKELRRIPQHSECVSDIAYTPDGRFLVGSVHGPGGGNARLFRFWDAATGRPKRSLNLAPDYYGRVHLSPDGRTFVLGQEKGPALGLFETATGQQRSLIQPPDHCNATYFSPDGVLFVTGGCHGSVHFWDAHTGQGLGGYAAHEGSVNAFALSPDGRRLATGGWDTTALVWDLGALLPTRSRARPLSPAELNSAWAELGGADAAKAYKAIGKLATASDQAALFLRERLRPVAQPDPLTIARLIADLDSDRFAVREKATADLEKLGELAEPALRRTLLGKPHPEVRRRVELLLQVLEVEVPSGRRLADLRAIEILEHIGTLDARQVLQRLANGAPEARLTQEAKGSLQRLAKRHAAMP